MRTFLSKCENDTFDFAREFAKDLNKNSVVVLSRGAWGW